MKITKKSKVDQSEIEIIDGVYYKLVPKFNEHGIERICKAPGEYCKTCRLFKKCVSMTNKFVWYKVK